jgi:tripartite-type tricarboxylate transporter receptor subunit TctC
LAGQIDLCFGSTELLPLMRDGSVKVYAETSDTRLALAPDILTFAELGLPALSEARSFVGAMRADLTNPHRGPVVGLHNAKEINHEQ